ncbi:MAG: NADH:flavin oxidoreductase [Acidobacteria bacterium]|nr:NADH:flavin oxidoreductase [Acidobacteriota bacterium]
MSSPTIVRLGSIKNISDFESRLRELKLNIPCDRTLASAAKSSLRWPLAKGPFRIGNRIAVQPMEGWDSTADGTPSDNTVRRWRRFGQTGAKLIWGGEAVAVTHSGRANPNQLVAAPHTERGLAKLRSVLIEEHRRITGSDEDLVIGLQLTHSGRYCRPNRHDRAEPKILYRHPILDRRLKLPSDYPLLQDSEIEQIIEDFHRAAAIAAKIGFDFVDIKHCHGYLGHEFLSAYTRDGLYGGSYENRTRFLREVVEGIRSLTPELHVGVRLSAFDTIPFHAQGQAPPRNSTERPGRGVPDTIDAALPYRWGFGLNPSKPSDIDLEEPIRFLSSLQVLGIHLLNLTAGSPYYNPHIQRPALYPPCDGYLPPEDPLEGVARQIEVTRQLKLRFPDLIIVGSAYSYLQDFLPYVAQAAVREEWVDCVGLGRMVLSYPELLWHASAGSDIERKRICRTFSDCTTAPRNGLPSGCYPLDEHYKNCDLGERLRLLKRP